MQIAIAGPHDAERIGEILCGEMYPEMGLGFAALDRGAAQQTIDRLLLSGRVLVLMDGTEIAGAIGLEKRTLWWSQQEIIGDLFFYLRKPYRTAKNARLLISAAQCISHDEGLPLILGGFGSPRLSTLNRFFRLLRFSEIGSLFLWRQGNG